MIYAEKGNRVRQINENDVDRYVELGYKITDGNGTLIKNCVPTDVAELKLAYVEHVKQIEELKALVLSLQSTAKQESSPKKTVNSKKVDTSGDDIIK